MTEQITPPNISAANAGDAPENAGFNRMIGIAYLALGVILLPIGLSMNWDGPLLYTSIASLFVMGVLAMLNLMKEATLVARIVVGSVFIVSGLIKANDALGFSYKLEEYFAENALGLTFFEPYSLAMSMLVSVGEVVLGLAVLFGGKARLASWALLLLTLFFAWLTWYTATCDSADTYITMVNGQEVTASVNCVTDCGCFGDAMKDSIGRSLTPWESFKKDMVLLIFVVIIFIRKGRISLNTKREDLLILPASLAFVGIFAGSLFGWYFPLVFTAVVVAAYLGMKAVGGKVGTDWPIAGMATAASLGFAIWCFLYLPQQDFRPYKVDTNFILERMDCSERGFECPQLAYIYVVKHKDTGVESEMLSTEYVAKFKEYEFVSNTEREVILQEGYEASILDFNLYDDEGSEYTDEVLHNKTYLLFVSKDVEAIATEDFAQMSALAAAAEAQGIPSFGTVAGYEHNFVDSVRHQHTLSFPFYSLDETTAKTVIRSNPGVVLVHDSIIVGKWSRSCVPAIEDITNKLN